MALSAEHTPYPFAVLLTVLLGHVHTTKADSFMDNWLLQQTMQRQQDWFQVSSSSGFNAEDWLAKQKAKNKREFLSVQEARLQGVLHKKANQNRELPPGQDASSQLAHGEAYDQEDWAPASSWEAEDLELSLLSDIEKALGKTQRQAMEGRIKVIENEMQPIFQALPKNEYNKMGHATVRYLLHRFFVEQHGWFISGLWHEGNSRTMSSPANALKNRVPLFVQGLFEKRLGGRGFGKHELAVMVAVVEDSVHRESQEQLLLTYRALQMPVDAEMSEGNLDLVVEAYMSGFVLNSNMSEISQEELVAQKNAMVIYYPTWPRAQNFFRRIRLAHTSGLTTLNFGVVSRIIREIVDTFGKFQGVQCQGLKQSLQALEKKGSSGCIRLPDFYEKGLRADINWLLVETPEYLRHIGVLDETEPQNPRLLSANYVTSPTNCLQPSGYYLVCCHNECDDILRQLEQQLEKPSATPAEILDALAKTSSNFSWLRGGNVAPAIRFRLEEVAEYDGGSVPIHGRLFAQWLHHVYPRECPYPHLSGAKHAQWIADFEKETGRLVQMSDAEMMAVVENASNTVAPQSNGTSNKLAANFGSCAPWQNEEELFAPLPSAMPLHELEKDPHVWNVMGAVALLGAASTFMITLMRTFKSLARFRPNSKMLHI